MKFDLSKIIYDGKDIRKKIKLTRNPTSELAEIVGIMLGDGSLYINKKLKFHTTISFHKNEYSYLSYVKSLFEKYFYPYSFYINELKDEILLLNISICIGRILKIVGLKEGNKVKNRVEIPKWIFSSRRFIMSLVKGMFDTDGCVYKKYANYAQIQFKFGSYPLVKSLKKALINLNFNPTKIQKELNQKGTFGWKFYLSRQKEIDRFFMEIKPGNTKHIERYNKIRNGDAGI